MPGNKISEDTLFCCLFKFSSRPGPSLQQSAKIGNIILGPSDMDGRTQPFLQ